MLTVRRLALGLVAVRLLRRVRGRGRRHGRMLAHRPDARQSGERRWPTLGG